MAPWARIFTIVAAVGGLAACVGEFAVPFILARWVPGYSHLRNVLSELGTAGSPVAFWMNLWWCVFGVLMMAFGVATALALPPAGDALRLMACLFLVFGLGAGWGAGLFSMDPAGSPVTLTGRLHNALGGIGFLALGLVPLVALWVFPRPTVPGMFWLSVATLAAGMVVVVLLSISGHGRGGDGPLSWPGLWQRAFLAVYYPYVAVLAVMMLRRAWAAG